MSKLTLPHGLSRKDLVEIVANIQALLYLDIQQDRDTWNPDKEWDADTCDSIRDVLDRHGLVPEDEQSCGDTMGQDVRQLVDWARTNGLHAEDLDDAVHETASSLASRINNDDLAEQIEFLVEQLGVPEAQDLLTQVAKNKTGG
jgi:hypothetical protein